MRLAHFRHKTILFNICVAACFLLLGLNAFSSVKFRDALLSVGKMQLPIASLNGCIQVVMCVLCIIMVLTDRKKGIVWSHVFLLFSVFGAVRTIFISKSLITAPGAFNAIIFLIAISLIAKQIKYSDMMAVTDTVTGLLNRYGFDNDLKSKIWSNGKGRVVIIHLDVSGP